VTEALRFKLEELEGADLFRRLQLEHDAGTSAIRAAFLSATKAFHPSRFARRPDDARELANEVFLLIKAAYKELSTETGRAKELKKVAPANAAKEAKPTKPGAAKKRAATPVVKMSPSSAPAKPTDRAMARGSSSAPSEIPQKRAGTSSREREERFAAAVAMVSQGDYDRAVDEFQKLAEENPNLTKFRVYLHYARGNQLSDGRRHADARKEFESALELHPNFFLASKALEALPGQGGGTSVSSKSAKGTTTKNTEKKPEEKRGLFSRLFRK